MSTPQVPNQDPTQGQQQAPAMPPPPPVYQRPPVYQQPAQQPGADGLNVNQSVTYVRQQKGHSIILHLILGCFCLWINVIYISASKNHYWHA